MAAPTMPRSRWVGAGLALFVAGSVVLLVGNGWLLAVALPAPMAWSSVPGLVVGGAGLAAGLRLWSRPQRAARVAGAIAMLALLLDLAGLSGIPRSLPAATLLAGAALVAGSTPVADDRLPPRAVVAATVGVIMHALVGLLLLPLGLVVPAWAMLILYAAWAALLAWAVRHRRDRPWLFLAAPVAAAALTAAMLYVGGALLHWTP